MGVVIMKSLTSLEILRLLDEIRFLKGAVISKIYHSEKTMRIKLFAPGKGSHELFISPNSIFLTKKHEETKPSNFAMFLRKKLKGRIIEDIKQRDFDRIIEIKTKDTILILELFHRGNYILTDSQYKIIMPLESQKWKDREVIKNRQYVPPPGVDIRTNLDKLLKTEEAIVSVLVKNGFGKYSEELLKIAKIDKNKKALEINDTEKKTLIESMHELFNKEMNPMIIFQDGRKFDAVPFDMNIYRGLEKKKFPTFSEALDDFFLVKKEDPLMGKQKRILESQEAAVKKWDENEKKIDKEIEILKNNYSRIKNVLDIVARKNNWDETKKELADYDIVKEIKEREGKIVFLIDSEKIEIKFTEPLNETLKKYYEAKKKIKKKRERALVEKEKTKTGMRKIETAKAGKILEKEEKKWYHKFNYFFTSDGFLVVAGKDAKTNELLIKKYAKENDIVFHAEIHGSPFALMKADDEITENALNEASVFTACYSKAWAMGLGAVDVYWVRGEQVDKKAPSGEYIGKGSFMIHGQRNYFRKIELKLAFGVFGGKVIVGPVDAVKKKTKIFAVIQPGEIKSNELAKKIKKKLIDMTNEKSVIEKIKLDKIQNRIPAARGIIIS